MNPTGPASFPARVDGNGQFSDDPNMTKQAEIEYAVKASQPDLYRRPYNCPRVFREFGTVLELFENRIPAGSPVLDIGCGPGWTSLLLARAGYEVLGVDLAERMIEIARERAAAELNPAEFAVADMDSLELSRKDYAGALFFDCLHHCPAYPEAIKRAYAHLRPGGYLALFETTWLHRYSPHARGETATFGITEQGFSRIQLRRALKGAGFTRLEQFHDPGPAFRGLRGAVWTTMRVWCDWITCFPQAKNIFVARKPETAG